MELGHVWTLSFRQPEQKLPITRSLHRTGARQETAEATMRHRTVPRWHHAHLSDRGESHPLPIIDKQPKLNSVNANYASFPPVLICGWAHWNAHSNLLITNLRNCVNNPKTPWKSTGEFVVRYVEKDNEFQSESHFHFGSWRRLHSTRTCLRFFYIDG